MYELWCMRVQPLLKVVLSLDEGGAEAMKIDFPEQPVWEPLQTVIGARCREFMFMGRVVTIYLYKHIWTRRYLNLDMDGKAYRFIGDEYAPVSLGEAIKHVFG